MKPEPASPLHRLNVGKEVFLCRRLPDVLDGREAEAAIAAALAAAKAERPGMLYWNARIEATPPGRIRFGRAGLDPLLACDHDLSSCTAISEPAFERLVARGAVKGEADFPRAVALLARAPGLGAVWCEGLEGVIDLQAPPPLTLPQGPATSADTLTLAILVHSPAASVEPFFAALKGQVLAGGLDVLVLALDHDSEQIRELTRLINLATAADPRMKVRRYAISGPLAPEFLANIAIGLATTEAVVLADAHCIPVTANAVQRLADWALSGDAAAACPRIVFDRRLVAAGLALAASGDGAESVVAWDDLKLSAELRTAAAPAPWFFAARRTAWLAAGGLRRNPAGPFWTAGFAFAHGPKGRTYLVGSEIAEWIGKERPLSAGQSAPAHNSLQTHAMAAIREPEPSSAPVPLLGGGDLVALPGASGSGQAAFSDRFPSAADLRVLVFADLFGASQSIAFVDGLAAARDRGAVAVRIVDETALPGDSRALQEAEAAELVDNHLSATQPQVIVVSRLGHSGLWRAVRNAARRDGIPVLCHLDDDILGLPATLGIERYRLARSPKRALTVQRILKEADLILAATPALAQRLKAGAGHDRVVALSSGAAGRPGARRTTAPKTRLRIGYMGSASHDHDLAMVVPALNRVLAAYDGVEVALFGSIAEQPSARRIEGAVERFGPVSGNYMGFRRRLSELAFDIGLAPLTDEPFNRLKTATKWAEYAEAGAATLVSPLGPYAAIVEAGAALGARPQAWEAGLRRLIESPRLRNDLTGRADQLLTERYGWDKLEQEVLAALDRVRTAKRTAA
ncbi:MAG: hypothetical protein B7Y99_03160 [Caulobacterales bacterium 32-69-10]|nr:MAG: hypothetical protein B7Y99_03160 [Caulobacterales bacterium 32-69-10]